MKTYSHIEQKKKKKRSRVTPSLLDLVDDTLYAPLTWKIPTPGKFHFWTVWINGLTCKGLYCCQGWALLWLEQWLLRAWGPFKSRGITAIGCYWVTKSLDVLLLIDSGRHPIDTCQGQLLLVRMTVNQRKPKNPKNHSKPSKNLLWTSLNTILKTPP